MEYFEHENYLEIIPRKKLWCSLYTREINRKLQGKNIKPIILNLDGWDLKKYRVPLDLFVANQNIFVVVSHSCNQDEFNEDGCVVVPTMREALQYIELEEIEKQLRS